MGFHGPSRGWQCWLSIPLCPSIEIHSMRGPSASTLLHAARDGRRWAEFGDLGGLQDLFGIEGGVIHVGSRATKAEGAAITVGVDAH